jgi:hypothetical protein
MKTTLALLLAAFLAVSDLSAAPGASVKGFITDQSGGNIANAGMTLASVDTGTEQRAKSDGNGFYQFLQVAPGKYNLSVEATGFRKAEIKGFALLVDQIASLDVRLEVGPVTETIEVTTTAPLIETEKISTGTTFDPKQLANLPILNRNFANIALLTPGVTLSAAGTQAGGFAAAGSRAQSTNWTIDGVNAVDPQVNGPTTSLRIADAVEEFSVQTSAWSAEYGRSSGAQVNVITKSGKNDFHGSAFWFVRNDVLNAKDFFTNKLNGVKPILRRNQYGLTAGGPIIRNKTFFFYSWEALKLKNPQTATAIVPTLADRASVLDPLAKNLLGYFPTPTDTAARAGAVNWVGNASSSTDDNTHLVRIDHALSSKDQMFGRYIWYGGAVVAAGTLPTTGGNTNSPGIQNLSISDVHTWSPTAISDIRLGFSRNKTDFRVQDRGFNAQTILPGVPGIVDGSKSIADSGIPNVAITGYQTLGSATNLPQGRITNTYELFLNHTQVAPFGWSKHTLKFGYAGRKEETARFLNSNIRGAATFNDLASFLGTCAACGGKSLLLASSIRTGDTKAYWYRYPHAFYIQDDVKAKTNLTLNFGLRYERPSASTEKSLRGSNFVEGVGVVLDGTDTLLTIDPLKRGRDAFVLSKSPVKLAAAGTTAPKGNFAPVAGFAWTPRFSNALFADGKTVIRGGFRLSFDDIYNNIPVNQALNAPFTLTTTQRVGVTQAAAYPWSLAFDQNIPLVARTTQSPGAPAVGLISFNALDNNAPSSYAYNWNFGLQRELTKNTSIDVSYIGTSGRKLGIYVDGNEPTVRIADSGFRGATAPNSQIYPFPQFGSISLAKFTGTSDYHGLVTTVRTRTRTLTMDNSYTWSHGLDNSSAFFGSTYDVGTPNTKTRLDLDRGNSANDQRHRFVNTFVYNLPFGRGQRFLSKAPGIVNQVLGGWSVSNLTNLSAGLPFTVYASTTVDFSGYNQLNDRPDAIGSGPLVLNRSNPDSFLDPAYFGKSNNQICPGYSVASNQRSNTGCAPAGRTGTSGRNAYQGPGIVNVDSSVTKKFPVIKERISLEYRADFFNILNHTNFALTSGNRTLNSGSFGQLSATSNQIYGGPRVIQMTLRATF